MKILSFILIVLLLFSCSSINRVSDIRSSGLAIGSASKQDVVNQIGLPNKVEEKGEHQYWMYSGKEAKRDLFIPLPIGASQIAGNTYQVYYTDIGPTTEYEFKPILVCVFDKENTLINVIRPSE